MDVPLESSALPNDQNTTLLLMCKPLSSFMYARIIFPSTLALPPLTYTTTVACQLQMFNMEMSPYIYIYIYIRTAAVYHTPAVLQQ